VIRIIGGRWGGRRLATPRGDATRPAADAFRGRVVNILGPDLPDVRVLDLFAGSGAFGLECLSRGAAAAVMVEKGRNALAAIRENVAALAPAPGAAVVVAGDAYRIADTVRPHGPFDIVFVAPPYPHFRDEREHLAALLAALADPALVAADADIVVQSDAGGLDSFATPGLARRDVRRMGRTDFTFLRRAGSDPPPSP
jgi:16S rRNA (guanine966-N2)-methyltransferase